MASDRTSANVDKAFLLTCASYAFVNCAFVFMCAASMLGPVSPETFLSLSTFSAACALTGGLWRALNGKIIAGLLSSGILAATAAVDLWATLASSAAA